MKLTNREKIFIFITLFYGIYTLLPCISNLEILPVYLPSLFVFLSLVILYPKVFYNKLFYWFCLYFLVLCVYYLLHKTLTIGIGTTTDGKKLLIECSYILPTLSIFCILSYINDEKINNIIIIILTCVLFLSFSVIIPTAYRINNVLRGRLFYSSRYTIDNLWLPSYALMHAYVFLLPIACFCFSVSKNKTKYLSFIILLLVFYLITQTSITTCIIISIFVILLTIYNYIGLSKKNFVISIFVFIIIIIFINEDFIIKCIDSTAPFFKDTSVESKIDNIRLSIIYKKLEGGSITVRQELHQQSWKCFFANPIIGTSNVGGHSALLDRLGGMGILGFIPYIMLLISFYSMMQKKIQCHKDVLFFFNLLWLEILIMQYVKAPQNNTFWFIAMIYSPYSMLCFRKYLFVKNE